MKPLNFLFFFLLMAALTPCPSTRADQKAEKDLASTPSLNTTRKLEMLVKKVNTYYRANNFQPLLPETGWKKESNIDKYYHHVLVDNFQTFSHEGSDQYGAVELLSDSSKPIKFFNHGMVRAANRESKGEETKNDLTEDKIKKISKDFADLFLSEWDIKDLQFEHAYWNKPYVRGSNGKGNYYYGAGYWKVIWRRITPSGIAYNDDSVSVDVYAKNGPSILSIFYTTRYDEKPFTKIGETKAMQLAKEVLPKVLKESGLNTLLGSTPTESQPARITEFIVRAPRRTSVSNPALNDGREGRHAYVVGFYLMGENNAGPSEKKLILHIDAETGELLNTVY